MDPPSPIGQKQIQNCASRTKLVFPACPVWVAQQAARNLICQFGRAGEGRRGTADPRLYHSQRPRGAETEGSGADKSKDKPRLCTLSRTAQPWALHASSQGLRTHSPGSSMVSCTQGISPPTLGCWGNPRLSILRGLPHPQLLSQDRALQPH